jgi:hypothetical protein
MSLNGKEPLIRLEEDHLKGVLVLPLQSTMVRTLGTRCGYLSKACWIRLTLSISGGARRRPLQPVVRWMHRTEAKHE